ncbi:hypothetical protein LLG95_17800 [bacterium]|nr:hypothetical protein [bacterium]
MLHDEPQVSPDWLELLEHETDPDYEPREFVPPPAVPALLLAGDPVVYHACQLRLGGRAVILHLLEMLHRAAVPHVEITTPPGDIDIMPLIESAPRPIPPVIITGQHDIGALAGVGVAQSYPNPVGLLVLEANRLLHPTILGRLSHDSRENLLLSDFSGTMARGSVKLQINVDQQILRYSSELNGLVAQGVSLGVLKIGSRALDEVRAKIRRQELARLSEMVRWVVTENVVHAIAGERFPSLRVRGRADLAGAFEKLDFLIQDTQS